MKDEDKQEIIDLFNQTLDGRDRIDAITHKVHHDQYAADLEERVVQILRRQVPVLLLHVRCAIPRGSAQEEAVQEVQEPCRSR